MFIKQLFIIITACTLSSTVLADETADRDDSDEPRRGSDCIISSAVRDYQVLDDSNLVVTASRNRAYHVELSRRVFGLRSTWRIGFKSHTSRVCAGFDEVIVNDSFGPEAVRISDIRLLTPDEHEELLIRFGRMEPEIEVTREPQEVEGAEVEELD